MPLLAAALAACAPQPAPRSVIDFMDDGLAREGVLIRCNDSREETVADLECINARRAEAAIALEADRARAPQLEQESEAKLLALRERDTRQAAAEQDAVETARAESEAAYEARWRDPAGPRAEGGPSTAVAPAFGAPLGRVMPSMTSSPSFDVYADGADPLGRRTLEIAAAEPPANDLVIASPRLEITDLAVVPQPFRADVDQQ